MRNYCDCCSMKLAGGEPCGCFECTVCGEVSESEYRAPGYYLDPDVCLGCEEEAEQEEAEPVEELEGANCPQQEAVAS